MLTQKYIRNYLQYFPQERAELQALLSFLEQTSPDKLFDRRNFSGHITASCMLMEDGENKILLLKHRSLDRWLQPGGHVESGDRNLEQAALRECCEETSIVRAQLRPVAEFADVPLNINTHYIPAKKGEPEHYHHDFCFLYLLKAYPAVRIDMAESTAYRWLSIQELTRLESFHRIGQQIARFLA